MKGSSALKSESSKPWLTIGFNSSFLRIENPSCAVVRDIPRYIEYLILDLVNYSISIFEGGLGLVVSESCLTSNLRINIIIKLQI